MLGRLPLTLLSLLLATVAYSESTSPNDPFKVIVSLIPRQPEPPICCLKPSPPIEAVDDDVLLSFEEWKAKQSQIQSEPTPEAGENTPSRTSHDAVGVGDPGEGSNATDDTGSPSQTADIASVQPTEILSPHFQVPITDRFNYASLDCSARVHTSHRGAKSASSILSSKKDRYMLSPCNTPKVQQFVVVELCEDIRIDTVQLANFEFFSGVFKDFAVSVAKTINGPWADAGIYRAKNIRGVQSFHTPALRDFYRFIRIDFHSHYGNEYYCPLSLLKVYGLTHLEQWKWELWEAESKAKVAEFERAAKLAIQSTRTSADLNATATLSVEPSPAHNTDTPESHQPIILGPASPRTDTATTDHASSPQNTASQAAQSIPNDTTQVSTTHASHSTDTFASHSSTSSASSPPPSTIHTAVSSQSTATPTPSPVPSVPSSISTVSPKLPAADTKSDGNTSSSSVRPATPLSSSATGSASPGTAHSSSLSTSSPPPSPPITTGGESIYGTIMHRLKAIESNHTLYTRYIGQQNGAIRDLIKRLGEDVGRLEAATRAQHATYQKTMNHWEKEKVQMIMDYNQLRSKVDHLSEEIVLEKRLGVIQLCLLLAVLVFMGLTRGSRAESVIVSGRASMREWGRRHLSFSGDWNRFMGRSSSGSPVRGQHTLKPGSPSKASARHRDDRVQFPASEDVSWKKHPLEQIQLNTAPLPSEYRAARQKKNSQPRSRTPSLRTLAASSVKRTPQTAVPQRSGTPTPIRAAHLRPQPLARSNSHGTHSSFYPAHFVPKSAKKWARTAHIHPAKPPNTAHRHNVGTSTARGVTDENAFVFQDNLDTYDVFSAPAGSVGFPKFPKSVDDLSESPGKGKDEREVLFSRGDDRDTESNWADTDSVVDSDVGSDVGSDVDVQFD